MPELPEVETTVRGLARVLEGRRITRVEARRADLRRAFPNDLGQRLTGARVTGLGRRAKYGLIHTDRGDTMIFHLGMSGRWRIDPAELGKHDHLLLETDEGRRLALNDPRRFGSVDLVPTDELDEWPRVRGARARSRSATRSRAELKRRLAGRTAAIKLLLLDQRIVAGLGNIYVCEALLPGAIDPEARRRVDLARGSSAGRRRSGRCSTKRSRRAARRLRDFARPDGELGYFSKQFAVYGREGEPCALRRDGASESSRAGARPSIARAASAEPVDDRRALSA